MLASRRRCQLDISPRALAVDGGDVAARAGQVVGDRGADHADLVIVGDLDPVQVKAAVTRLLGDWKSPVAYQCLGHPPSDVVSQRLVTPLKDKANAVVIGQLPLKLQDTDADYPALMLASNERR